MAGTRLEKLVPPFLARLPRGRMIAPPWFLLSMSWLIVRLERGDAKPRLLAFAEARGSYADVDENDLVMRVSDDDGRTK